LAKEVLKSDNFIKFIGTAGARFVMLKQLRSSGGIWLAFKKTNVLIDPGPGSLLLCLSSRPKLDPMNLDALILTHRHLDHSADTNVILEAMTEGGFKKRGIFFAPSDVFEPEPIVLSHLKQTIGEIKILTPHNSYQIGNIKFSTGPVHIHPVETYGFRFKFDKKTVSLISDTNYFRELIDFYRSEILIINVVFYQKHSNVEHLSLQEAEMIIRKIRPEVAILTHFGMSMLKAKPYILEKELNDRLNIKIICAYDGMKIEL
jgi:phosphoribosyl 1,2-cyclic phosphodiesterase